MSNLLQESMSEATCLSKEGRLAEATAAIQRALGGISTPISSENTGGSEGSTVEMTSQFLEEADQPPESGHFARSAVDHPRQEALLVGREQRWLLPTPKAPTLPLRW